MITVNDAITKPVHRLEVFTGAGRRRAWSDEDKAWIVDKIVASGESLSAVARRHGLSPQQLFGWRGRLRDAEPVSVGATSLEFVPAVVAEPASIALRGKLSRKSETNAGTIEVEIEGVIIRIGRGAMPRRLRWCCRR
jgi:transposase